MMLLIWPCRPLYRIDFSLTHSLRGMQLQQIRTTTLISLRYYTKQAPRPGKGSGFQSVMPALRLYLANNLLDEVLASFTI